MRKGIVKAASVQGLSAAQSIMLTKFDPGAARQHLTPGEYQSFFTVDVSATIRVGEDSEMQRQVPWKAIALALLEGKDLRVALRVAKRAIESPNNTSMEGRLKERLSPLLGKSPTLGRVTGSCLIRIHEGEK